MFRSASLQGEDLQLVINIYDADRIETMPLALNLEGAQKLVEDLTGAVETVESILARPDDRSH